MRNQKRYQQKVQKASKVLLVCIYDTVVLNITNQMIRSKFQPFGVISKLLIFQKGQVTKLFIQFQQIFQATQAKKKLDGTKLYDSICKMSIFYSNFANVQVVNQPQQIPYFNEQVNYPINYQPQHFATLTQTYTTHSTKGNQTFDFNIDDEDIMNSFSNFGGLKKSKTENPSFLKQHIQSVNSNSNNINTSMNSNTNMNFNVPCRYVENTNSYSNNPTNYRMGQYNPLNYKIKKQEQSNILKQQAQVRSSILFFGYKHDMKTKFLYNLFSNFGNISCIIKKKQYIYIKFRTKQFAAMANTYLNNTVLMNNSMQLRQCPQSSTCWKLNQGQYCQSVYFDSTADRFTAQRSITINPPANTIHVSSIKKDICKQKALRDIFSQYGRIDKIQILKNTGDKNMALIRFQTIQDSFNAIANLHNQSFQGRKLQISFTKSKF